MTTEKIRERYVLQWFPPEKSLLQRTFKTFDAALLGSQEDDVAPYAPMIVKTVITEETEIVWNSADPPTKVGERHEFLHRQGVRWWCKCGDWRFEDTQTDDYKTTEAFLSWSNHVSQA